MAKITPIIIDLPPHESAKGEIVFRLGRDSNDLLPIQPALGRIALVRVPYHTEHVNDAIVAQAGIAVRLSTFVVLFRRAFSLRLCGRRLMPKELAAGQHDSSLTDVALVALIVPGLIPVFRFAEMLRRLETDAALLASPPQAPPKGDIALRDVITTPVDVITAIDAFYDECLYRIGEHMPGGAASVAGIQAIGLDQTRYLARAILDFTSL